MENLPIDIIICILSRLPAKSLLRFKSVCKLWLTIINSPTFANLHLSQSFSSNSNRLLIVAAFDSNFYSVDLDSPEFPWVKLRLPHNFKGRKLEFGGSCNGVICMYTNPSNFILMNPSTQQYKEIPKVYVSSSTRFGLGFDYVSCDYKLVTIHDRYVMVYSSRKDLWKTSRVFCNNGFFNDRIWDHTGVLIGSHLLHWMMNSWLPEGPLFIGCFNVCNEEWSVLALPNCTETGTLVGDDYLIKLGRFGVLDGCLCLLTHENRDFGAVNVWIMKEYGVAESWVRLWDISDLDVTLYLWDLPFVSCKQGREILVKKGCGLSFFNWYDLHYKTVRDAEIPRLHEYKDVLLCWGSLASIFGGVKIGKESQDEQHKRRYASSLRRRKI